MDRTISLMKWDRRPGLGWGHSCPSANVLGSRRRGLWIALVCAMTVAGVGRDATARPSPSASAASRLNAPPPNSKRNAKNPALARVRSLSIAGRGAFFEGEFLRAIASFEAALVVALPLKDPCIRQALLANLVLTHQKAHAATAEHEHIIAARRRLDELLIDEARHRGRSCPAADGVRAEGELIDALLRRGPSPVASPTSETPAAVEPELPQTLPPSRVPRFAPRRRRRQMTDRWPELESLPLRERRISLTLGWSGGAVVAAGAGVLIGGLVQLQRAWELSHWISAGISGGTIELEPGEAAEWETVMTETLPRARRTIAAVSASTMAIGTGLVISAIVYRIRAGRPRSVPGPRWAARPGLSRR